MRPAGPAVAIVGSENATERGRARRRDSPRGFARGRLRDAHGSRGRDEPGRREAARACGDHRRDESRGRELPHVLEGDDVLERARADHLPPRLRRRAGRDADRRRRRTSSTSSSSPPGMVATAVIFSSAFPSMFGTFVKHRFQNTYDAILAAPVDVEELVTAEVLWISLRAGFYGCFPADRRDVLRPRPRVGDASRAALRVHHGDRLLRLRDRDGGDRRQDRPLQLRDHARDHAALPRRRHVLPDRPAPAGGAGRSLGSTRSTTWSSSFGARLSASSRWTCIHYGDPRRRSPSRCGGLA